MTARATGSATVQTPRDLVVAIELDFDRLKSPLLAPIDGYDRTTGW